MQTLRMEEKRRFPRVNLNTQLKYRIRGKTNYAHALANNISVGGLGLLNQEFIAPSTLLMLEINLRSRVLHPVGKVVSAFNLPHSERNRLGLEFLEMPSEEKDYLKDFIKLKTDQF